MREIEFLDLVDAKIKAAFELVFRLCREAHMDGEAMERVLAGQDRAFLKAISDTADEVLMVACTDLLDARWAIVGRRDDLREVSNNA